MCIMRDYGKLYISKAALFIFFWYFKSLIDMWLRQKALQHEAKMQTYKKEVINNKNRSIVFVSVWVELKATHHCMQELTGRSN